MIVISCVTEAYILILHELAEVVWFVKLKLTQQHLIILLTEMAETSWLQITTARHVSSLESCNCNLASAFAMESIKEIRARNKIEKHYLPNNLGIISETPPEFGKLSIFTMNLHLMKSTL